MTEVCKIDENPDDNVLDVIRNNKVNYVVNTLNRNDGKRAEDGFLIRRVSAENNVFCMTSPDTVNALLGVLESRSFSMMSMNELHQ